VFFCRNVCIFKFHYSGEGTMPSPKPDPHGSVGCDWGEVINNSTTRVGGIFNNQFATNLPRNLPVKNFF